MFRIRARPANSPWKRTFVYAISGDRDVERLNLSIRLLKRFTRASILIVASGVSERLEHDQVLRVAPEEGLTAHQMGLLLKTNLHRLIADPWMIGCYLDTDIVATSKEVDSIFEIGGAPFAFAPDFVDMSAFSSWAVNCGCVALRCEHLAEAIAETFDVVVDGNWQHWNGGVFVFTPAAAPLQDCWHEFTRATFGDPMWKPRDQGTLIAAAWKLGLQETACLDTKFNFIVDCFRGLPVEVRTSVANEDLPYDDSYVLPQRRGWQFGRRESQATSKPRPVLLHFINGGIMRPGWKNWDEAAQMAR